MTIRVSICQYLLDVLEHCYAMSYPIEMYLFEFILRGLLIFFWFFFTSFVGIVMVLFRWKNPDLDAIFARMLSWGAMRALGYRIRVENQSRLYLHQPCVYVANHQTNLDIITYGGIYPWRTVLIGKKELKKIPLFGLFFWGAGNIMIDRKNLSHSVAGLNVAQDAIQKDGVSVWVFPEGTRNRGATELLPFKKGAFYMAIQAGVPIVPIVHQHLTRYFDLASKRIYHEEIVIKILEPILTTGLTSSDLPALMDKVRTQMQSALLTPDMSPRIPALRG